MPEFDLAVIGAGAAGLTITAVAAQLGLRVALIERARMGGDCLNTGCVPSKSLLASAHAVQSARHAAQLGITFAAPQIDWTAIQAHVQGVIATIAPMDSAARFTALGATVIAGEARFTSPDTLDISGHGRLTARRIVIATGGRATIPPIPGLDSVPYLTNETLFSLPAPPKHLLILGGGPIGLEMAQAHAALGCQVTISEASRIAAREDAELADGLRRVLAADGITLLENARVTSAAPGPTLTLADGREITGSHLLIAAGRTPNLEALALDAGGVRASTLGIATDAGLRSLSNPRVYAAGDIADPAGIGPRAFTHVGTYHAGIIIRRALFRMPARVDYRALPRVIYTAPELAQVGLTEAEAGPDHQILRWPLADNDRAQAERRTAGLVKLIIDRRGRIAGAGILAPHAGEMIGMWTLAIQQHIKLSALAGMIMPYPTLAEAGKRAAGQYFTPQLFAPLTKRIVRWLAWLP